MNNNFMNIMQTNRTILVSIAFLMFSAWIFQSCSSASTDDDSTIQKYILPDSLFKTLKTDTVSECPLLNSLTLTGQVDFNEDEVAKIYPMVSGTVNGINVMLGDHVSKGQALAVIQSSEMAGYSNDLVNAETNLQVAKKNLDATQDMLTSGLASQKDVLNAQASYTQAQSELNRINSVLKINGGSTQGNYVVKSPINGFIIDKGATNNMAIRTDNSSSLFTISDLGNVWILANVYESNISKVHLGDSVDVTTLSYPNKVFKGRIDKILNVLDPTNKVMKIRVVLPNPGYLLKPQMFASVTINTKEDKQTTCIPSSALVFDDNQYYVLVYKSRSDIQIKPVRVIDTHGDKTFVSEGVSTGDVIISSQVLLIYQALNT
jgi:cobalt-zinc-cadmium efflux system membrane fusion protein